MFSVNDFKANIDSNGWLPTNRFKVEIPVPDILAGSFGANRSSSISSSGTSNLLTFRAEQVKAPGITLNSSDVFRHGVGIRQAMPYSGSYTDNVISFISDGRGDIWSFWYLWLRSIFDFAGNDQFKGFGSSLNSLPSYDLEYKEKYATRITITVFDQQEKEVQKINMYDAFPISINDVQLGWGMNNEALRITVGLSFKEISIEGVGVNQTPTGTRAPAFTPNVPLLNQTTNIQGTGGSFTP